MTDEQMLIVGTMCAIFVLLVTRLLQERTRK